MTTILIVEDDDAILAEMDHLLREEGYGVVLAGNGAGALDLLRTAEPRVDLVILDLMMPNGSGWELLLEMRAQTFLARVPVVIVSALAAPPDRLGVQAYLRKPFDRGALLNTVQRVLGLRLTARADREPAASSQQESAAPVSTRPVHVLIVEDNDDIRESEAALLQEHGFHTTTAREGVEALDVLFLEDPPVDLVVLDLMMPKCSGWEMLAQMGAHSVLSQIPVLVVSALEAPPEDTRFQGYVRKPFRPEVLLSALDRLTAGSRAAHR